jgi:hypothetical protein
VEESTGSGGDAIKVLGQLNAAATTLETLYTVPGATTTAISTVMVCNRNAFEVTFRLSVQVAGAADTGKQYLYYDMTLSANDTFAATIGITLGATDVVKTYASTTGVSFNIFGTEMS